MDSDVSGLVERLSLKSDPESRDAASAVQAQAAEIERLGQFLEIESCANDLAQAKLREAVEVMRRVEPYLDAIICYASAMDEHEPNRIAAEFRAFLATMEKTDDKG